MNEFNAHKLLSEVLDIVAIDPVEKKEFLATFQMVGMNLIADGLTNAISDPSVVKQLINNLNTTNDQSAIFDNVTAFFRVCGDHVPEEDKKQIYFGAYTRAFLEVLQIIIDTSPEEAMIKVDQLLLADPGFSALYASWRDSQKSPQ